MVCSTLTVIRRAAIFLTSTVCDVKLMQFFGLVPHFLHMKILSIKDNRNAREK